MASPTIYNDGILLWVFFFYLPLPFSSRDCLRGRGVMSNTQAPLVGDLSPKEKKRYGTSRDGGQGNHIATSCWLFPVFSVPSSFYCRMPHLLLRAHLITHFSTNTYRIHSVGHDCIIKKGILGDFTALASGHDSGRKNGTFSFWFGLVGLGLALCFFFL